MRLEVGKQAWEEIVRLQLMAYAESATTRHVFQRQGTKARALLAQVTAEAAASQLRVAVLLFEFYDEIPIAQQKACGLSSSMQKAELLLNTAQEWNQTSSSSSSSSSFSFCSSAAPLLPPPPLTLASTFTTHKSRSTENQFKKHRRPCLKFELHF